MPDCGTVGSVEKSFAFNFLWKIPKFSFLTANEDDFYRSPDIHHLDNVWYLRIYPKGMYLFRWFTYLQLRRKNGVIAVWFKCTNISFGEAVIRKRSFGAGTCLESGLYPLMDHKVLLKRLEKNIIPDELRIMLKIWTDEETSSKVTDKKRLSREIKSEDVSSYTSVREDLREQLDVKVSRETQTEDVSSDTAVREELREQLDVKVSRETQTGDVSSDSADREEQPEHLDVKSLVCLGQNLMDLYLREKNYDVTITVRNRTFKAHRAVLEARAPLLADIRSHRMTESSDETICVMDCEPNAFAVFLLFVYSGTVENLSGENVADVFFVADKYALPELKEKCVRYMLGSLATGSICNILALASRHDERELLERATEFFIENAQDILPTVQWRRFMVENPDQANELYMKSLAFYASEK